MEAAVQGLAAVIVNSYRGASHSRGLRGTAGSGSGARTLVEGLSFSITHNHWLAVNHLDLYAALPLQDPDRETVQDREAEASGSRARGFEAPPIDASKVKTCGDVSRVQYTYSHE